MSCSLLSPQHLEHYLAQGGLSISTGQGNKKMYVLGFPGGSEVKESASNAEDPGSISGSGRSPGEGNSFPLQDSSLETSMDRGAWWATVYGVTKSQTQLSN